jgi:hypothetical protein
VRRPETATLATRSGLRSSRSEDAPKAQVHPVRFPADGLPQAGTGNERHVAFGPRHAESASASRSVSEIHALEQAGIDQHEIADSACLDPSSPRLQRVSARNQKQRTRESVIGRERSLPTEPFTRMLE